MALNIIRYQIRSWARQQHGPRPFRRRQYHPQKLSWRRTAAQRAISSSPPRHASQKSAGEAHPGVIHEYTSQYNHEDNNNHNNWDSASAATPRPAVSTTAAEKSVLGLGSALAALINPNAADMVATLGEVTGESPARYLD